MSLKFEDLKAIRDSRGLTPKQKHCLMTIYSRGDEHTASIPTLTVDMGYAAGSVSYVREILKTLKDKGLITVVERSGDTSEITINTRALQALVPPKVTPPARRSPPAQRRGGYLPAGGHPSSIQEPKDNPKDNGKDLEQSSAGAADLSLEAKDKKIRDTTASLIAEKRRKSMETKSGQKEATPPVERRGTPDAEIDYDKQAQIDGVYSAYKGWLNISVRKPGEPPRPRSPRSAYRKAMQAQGKEVRL